MDIGELVRNLNETRPYWGLYATGGALLLGLGLGRFIYHKGSEEPDTQIPYQSSHPSAQGQQEKQDDDEPQYEKRSIALASLPDAESRIKGVVQVWYPSFRGFSGIIADNSAEMPFYLDVDAIQTYQEEGLVPILLDDSKRSETPMEMDVTFDGDLKVFNVEGLVHQMGSKSYEIKSIDEE